MKLDDLNIEIHMEDQMTIFDFLGKDGSDGDQCDLHNDKGSRGNNGNIPREKVE